MSYLRRVPAKDATIGTKDVAPPEWPQPDANGVWPEGAGRFAILAFTRPEYVKDATTKATSRTTGANGRVTETVDNAVFLKELFNTCLKGWSNLLDPDTDEAIPFTPENVAALPDDAQGFLVEEILKAGRGILSGRDVVTKEEGTGAPLDRKSADGQVSAGDAQGSGDLPQ